MNWLLFWIVVYLAVVVVLALYHLRTSDLDQYLVNNRNTKTLPLVFTMLATLVGGGTSIGLMALGYESGFAAVGIGIGYVIGFMVLTRYAGRIRTYGDNHSIYSFPHFLNHKFTSPQEVGFTRIFSATVSGVNIFIFFFILSAQFVAMAKLLEFSFGIHNYTATIISAVIIIIYTAIAGLSGVIITDTIQFLAIIVMIILIFLPGVRDDTQWFTRMSELPADFLTGTHLGYAFLFALFIFLPWSVLVRMDVWQRILAAKSEKVARRVSFWSGMGMLPFYIIFPLVGMSVKLFLDRQLGPDETAGVVYMFIERHTGEILLLGRNAGPLLFGFAIIGLISALMSSGDSFLNIISISTVKDFVGWGKKKGDISKEKAHFLIRVTTIVFGIIALFVAIVFPNIVDLMVVGISTITIFAPITLFALVSKNSFAYRKSALASILSAFVVNISLFAWGIIRPDQFQAKSSFIPAFIVAILVLVIGVRMARTNPENDQKLQNAERS